MPVKDEVSFYFGRLNLISALRGKQKTDFIVDSLKTNKQISEREYKWGFFNGELKKIEDELFYCGLLVKYKQAADEEIVDEKNNILKLTSIPDKAKAKSEFLLHLKTGIIAYHPVINSINNNQFKKIFCKLIENANDNLFVSAEILAIDDETRIFDAIKKFQKINSLVIKLHPSNPSNRDRWKRTDEKLHSMNVEYYTEIYGGKEGMKINEDSDAYGNIIMATDGYGEAKISGIRNGKKSTVSTKKIPIKTIAPKNNSKSMALKLFPSFKKIFERFIKK